MINILITIICVVLTISPHILRRCKYYKLGWFLRIVSFVVCIFVASNCFDFLNTSLWTLILASPMTIYNYFTMIFEAVNQPVYKK